MTGKKRVLPVQGQRADKVLDRVGVHLAAPVLEEHAQTLPVVGHVGERAAHRRFARQPRALLVDPGLELLDDWPRACLPVRQALLRRLAADLLLDGIEAGDLPQQLVGDRRALGGRRLDDLPARMAPAVGEHQRLAAAALWPGEAAITAIAIDLQDAVKALEDMLVVDAATPRSDGVRER